MSWLIPSALEGLVGRKDGEPKALEPISELEHGFWPSESCGDVRVGTWSRLVLLQSFHLAAKNLHMLLIPPGHFKQTGVSVAVCQTDRGTGESGHLQAGHTRPGDSAKGQKCTETTKVSKDRPSQTNLYGYCTEASEQAWCLVVSKEVPQQLWVTQVRQSSVCHASPMN